MFPRWWRLGIRPQLTIIVILGAILSTAATLFIADNAIQNYTLDQAKTQEMENMKIANLVLETQYGQNVSISSDNQMVVDTPGSGKDVSLDAPNFGRYPLNDNVDYVDQVQQLIHASVSVYQCANKEGDFTPCNRIATTFTKKDAQGGLTQRATGVALTTSVVKNMSLDGTPREWLGVDTLDGIDYYADYTPLYNPQHQLIGVLFVGVPLDTVIGVVNQTTVELVLIGTVIMIAGVIFALFFANTIVTTLQRAARQVSGASERIGGIAAQQANGSAQQVWAINAINQALQNFSETARDISQRTDQLALMGNQVLQRRAEISPPQIDSILAYITRSVRDISVASRQQASQYERMTGAMQAVIEIAEQVAGNSQQSSESSERLELVVRQLRQLVSVRTAQRDTTETGAGAPTDTALNGNAASNQSAMKGTVRAIRPASQNADRDKITSGELGQVDVAGMRPIAGQQGGEMGRMGIFGEQPQQMAPAMPAAPAMRPMGGIPVAGGRGGMQAGQGQVSGRPIGSGAQGPMNGAGTAWGQANMNGNGMTGMGPAGAPGHGTPFGGQDNDWRLPPMPEMPPMPGVPGWGDGQGAPGARSGGRGMQGPNSGPNSRPNTFGGPSGPNGTGWPHGR
ncbi:MAG: cache domain-containing protein [Ktedonobacterales bacterium]